MGSHRSFKDVIRTRASSLCLVAILAATFTHTARFMSQFFYDSIILGGTAGFAIDAGLVAMSLYREQLNRAGQLATMVKLVTVTVLLVSGLANMNEGFASKFGMEASLKNIMGLDWWQFITFLGGTAVFPLLAYVMADTVGDQLIEAIIPASTGNEREEDSPRRKTRRRKPDIENANAARQQSKAERIEQLKAELDENPDLSVEQLRKKLGLKSRSTVYDYLEEIETTNGQHNV